MAASRRESSMPHAVTTRSKSQQKKKPGRKPNSSKVQKSKTSTPKPSTSQSKTGNSAGPSETISLSPTPPHSPVSCSSPFRPTTPCSDDEWFNIITIDVSSSKRLRKPDPPVVVNTEYYPDKFKRLSPEKKIKLQHKFNLKRIGSKRKTAFPKKEPAEDTTEPTPDLEDSDKSEDEGRGGEIQLITDDLRDDDWEEILNCESPVWWEEAPNKFYDEAPIDRSIVEEARELDSPLPLEEDITMRANEIHRSNYTYFKKKSKLENVLGNIKSKKIITDDSNAGNRESRCSESSEGDILSDISLNGDEMLKSLDNIVIPVEKTNMISDNDDDVAAKQFDVHDTSTVANDGNESEELADEGETLSQDTERNNLGRVENNDGEKDSGEKSDAGEYTLGKVPGKCNIGINKSYTEQIKVSDFRKRIPVDSSCGEDGSQTREDIDRGDVKMYVKIDKENINLDDFNKIHGAGNTGQRSNSATIFTDYDAVGSKEEERLGKNTSTLDVDMKIFQKLNPRSEHKTPAITNIHINIVIQAGNTDSNNLITNNQTSSDIVSVTDPEISMKHNSEAVDIVNSDSAIIPQNVDSELQLLNSYKDEKKIDFGIGKENVCTKNKTNVQVIKKTAKEMQENIIDPALVKETNEYKNKNVHMQDNFKIGLETNDPANIKDKIDNTKYIIQDIDEIVSESNRDSTKKENYAQETLGDEIDSEVDIETIDSETTSIIKRYYNARSEYNENELMRGPERQTKHDYTEDTSKTENLSAMDNDIGLEYKSIFKPEILKTRIEMDPPTLNTEQDYPESINSVERDTLMTPNYAELTKKSIQEWREKIKKAREKEQIANVLVPCLETRNPAESPKEINKGVEHINFQDVFVKSISKKKTYQVVNNSDSNKKIDRIGSMLKSKYDTEEDIIAKQPKYPRRSKVQVKSTNLNPDLDMELCNASTDSGSIEDCSCHKEHSPDTGEPRQVFKYIFYRCEITNRLQILGVYTENSMDSQSSLSSQSEPYTNTKSRPARCDECLKNTETCNAERISRPNNPITEINAEEINQHEIGALDMRVEKSETNYSPTENLTNKSRHVMNTYNVGPIDMRKMSLTSEITDAMQTNEASTDSQCNDDLVTPHPSCDDNSRVILKENYGLTYQSNRQAERYSEPIQEPKCSTSDRSGDIIKDPEKRYKSETFSGVVNALSNVGVNMGPFRNRLSNIQTFGEICTDNTNTPDSTTAAGINIVKDSNVVQHEYAKALNPVDFTGIEPIIHAQNNNTISVDKNTYIQNQFQTCPPQIAPQNIYPNNTDVSFVQRQSVVAHTQNNFKNNTTEAYPVNTNNVPKQGDTKGTVIVLCSTERERQEIINAINKAVGLGNVGNQTEMLIPVVSNLKETKPLVLRIPANQKEILADTISYIQNNREVYPIVYPNVDINKNYILVDQNNYANVESYYVSQVAGGVITNPYESGIISLPAIDGTQQTAVKDSEATSTTVNNLDNSTAAVDTMTLGDVNTNGVGYTIVNSSPDLGTVRNENTIQNQNRFTENTHPNYSNAVMEDFNGVYESNVIQSTHLETPKSKVNIKSINANLKIDRQVQTTPNNNINKKQSNISPRTIEATLNKPFVLPPLLKHMISEPKPGTSESDTESLPEPSMTETNGSVSDDILEDPETKNEDNDTKPSDSIGLEDKEDAEAVIKSSLSQEIVIISSDEEDKLTKPKTIEADIDDDVPKIESKMDRKKNAKLLQIFGHRGLPRKYIHGASRRASGDSEKEENVNNTIVTNIAFQKVENNVKEPQMLSYEGREPSLSITEKSKMNLGRRKKNKRKRRKLVNVPIKVEPTENLIPKSKERHQLKRIKRKRQKIFNEAQNGDQTIDTSVETSKFEPQHVEKIKRKRLKISDENQNILEPREIIDGCKIDLDQRERIKTNCQHLPDVQNVPGRTESIENSTIEFQHTDRKRSSLDEVRNEVSEKQFTKKPRIAEFNNETDIKHPIPSLEPVPVEFKQIYKERSRSPVDPDMLKNKYLISSLKPKSIFIQRTERDQRTMNETARLLDKREREREKEKNDAINEEQEIDVEN